MAFKVKHVARGENPPPPLGQRRVLISHTRLTDSPEALQCDEWGAVIRYSLTAPGSLTHAQVYAAQWAAAEERAVTNLYIEDDPDAQGS